MRVWNFRYPGDERVCAGWQVQRFSIVFACDTAPELETEAPKGMVKVYPRQIDLDNTARLKSFKDVAVVETLAERH